MYASSNQSHSGVCFDASTHHQQLLNPAWPADAKLGGSGFAEIRKPHEKLHGTFVSEVFRSMVPSLQYPATSGQSCYKLEMCGGEF